MRLCLREGESMQIILHKGSECLNVCLCEKGSLAHLCLPLWCNIGDVTLANTLKDSQSHIHTLRNILHNAYKYRFIFYIRLFPISRSLSTSCWMTDKLGSRLERPIHFECKLNEPKHIGMRLLYPAAADHSVSISRQQVHRIFSFSLRSRAVTSADEWIQGVEHALRKTLLDSRSGTALQRWWFFPCRVDCRHQAALPTVCVAVDLSPQCISAR